MALASILAAWTAGVPPAGAAEDEAAGDGLEISGLILDETRTKAGRDFLDRFQAEWREVAGIAYTITVLEQPVGGRGGFVGVDVDDDRIYWRRMTPRLEWVETEAKVAANLARAFLLRRRETETDLERDFAY